MGSTPNSNLSPRVSWLFYWHWPKLTLRVFAGLEVRSAAMPFHPLPTPRRTLDTICIQSIICLCGTVNTNKVKIERCQSMLVPIFRRCTSLKSGGQTKDLPIQYLWPKVLPYCCNVYDSCPDYCVNLPGLGWLFVRGDRVLHHLCHHWTLHSNWWVSAKSCQIRSLATWVTLTLWRYGDRHC